MAGHGTAMTEVELGCAEYEGCTGYMGIMSEDRYILCGR